MSIIWDNFCYFSLKDILWLFIKLLLWLILWRNYHSVILRSPFLSGAMRRLIRLSKYTFDRVVAEHIVFVGM